MRKSADLQILGAAVPAQLQQSFWLQNSTATLNEEISGPSNSWRCFASLAATIVLVTKEHGGFE